MGCKILKRVTWPWPRPFQGIFFCRQGGIHQCTKYQVSMFIRYEARMPTWVSLIYRTETTTRRCKTEKRQSKDGHAQKQCFFVTVRAGTAYRKIWRLVNIFFCSHNKVHCSDIRIVLSNLLYHYFFHRIMAHFNFVISQNAKWGMPVFTLIATGWPYRKIFFYKKALLRSNSKNGESM